MVVFRRRATVAWLVLLGVFIGGCSTEVSEFQSGAKLYEVTINSVTPLTEPDRFEVRYTVNYLGEDPTGTSRMPFLSEYAFLPTDELQTGLGETVKGDSITREMYTTKNIAKSEQEFYLVGPSGDGGGVNYEVITIGPRNLE